MLLCVPVLIIMCCIPMCLVAGIKGGPKSSVWAAVDMAFDFGLSTVTLTMLYFLVAPWGCTYPGHMYPVDATNQSTTVNSSSSSTDPLAPRLSFSKDQALCWQDGGHVIAALFSIPALALFFLFGGQVRDCITCACLRVLFSDLLSVLKATVMIKTLREKAHGDDATKASSEYKPCHYNFYYVAWNFQLKLVLAAVAVLCVGTGVSCVTCPANSFEYH